MSQQQSPKPAEMFDKYFGPALFTPWARVLLGYADPQPGERVLDLACGTGTMARHVAPVVGATGKVLALDKSSEMLAVGRSYPPPQGAPIEWRTGDATALDLPDGGFDLVLCQQGLQFFADRSEALGEMQRVLADGGRVVLDVWQALDRHPVYEALCVAEANQLGMPLSEVAVPWSLSDPEELRALLNEAGFDRVEVIPRSLDVHFPSPERFVYLTLFAAAAFSPDLDWDDEASRAALIEAISLEIEPVLHRYLEGGRLTFPVSWNIAVAHVP